MTPMNDTKLRTRINRYQLDVLEECRALLLKSMIKQGERDEIDGGYMPGELTTPDRIELHKLLENASRRWKEGSK